MMRHAKVAVLMIALSILAGEFPPPARADLSFSFFYSSLSPHGSWLVSAQNGRVWRPGVFSPGWNPYYDGHWVYSDLGWTWVSDYDWGGIPYHYGTWVEDPALGWVWVPGYVWAPSWVVFRTGTDYVGWAPVPPGFSVGASFDVGGSGFVFVSTSNFLAPSIRTCVVPERTTRAVLHRTRVVNAIAVQNSVVVNRGPEIGSIEKAIGRKIVPTPIEKVTRAGPGPRFSRSGIQVAQGGSARPLRATAPYSARNPLPRGHEQRLENVAHAGSNPAEAGPQRAAPERGGVKSHAERTSPEPRPRPAAGNTPRAAGHGPAKPADEHQKHAQPNRHPPKGRLAPQSEGSSASGGAEPDRDGSDGGRI
jgi:hypothetical protein